MQCSAPDEDRAILRKHCLELRNRIDPALKRQLDANIIAALSRWLENKYPENPVDAWLALWWPIGSEPDWRGQEAVLRRSGWQLALPCVIAKDQALRFARYAEGTVLRKAAMGMLEPANPRWVEPWVMTAPCVGYWQRYRMGYGGGFYDRSMAALDSQARQRSAAIAYSACEIKFEPQAHDIAFGTVITELSMANL